MWLKLDVIDNWKLSFRLSLLFETFPFHSKCIQHTRGSVHKKINRKVGPRVILVKLKLCGNTFSITTINESMRSNLNIIVNLQENKIQEVSKFGAHLYNATRMHCCICREVYVTVSEFPPQRGERLTWKTTSVCWHHGNFSALRQLLP